MRSSLLITMLPSMFQSAPADEGGRCVLSHALKRRHSRFQSAPADEGGRCRAWAVPVKPATLFQSAPADEGGRCAPAARPSPRRPPSFNPRPPMKAGDACTTVGLSRLTR